MARRPPAPRNSRNGLKWRPQPDGTARPRWEPSPASRAVGLRGLDLKDLEGQWLSERGLAIAVCDSRQLWAGKIREAAQGGPAGDAAASDLRRALEALQQPQEPAQRLRRLLVKDLLDAAQATLAGQDAAAGVQLVRAPRTVERLVDAYFAAVDAGQVVVAAATRAAYWTHAKAVLAKFPGRGVGSIGRAELIAWYKEMERGGVGRATANARIATAGALLSHAFNLEWTGPSVAVDLGIQKAQGRRVYWTLEEELSFTPWCDAHGYADVADAVVALLWTGARPVDAVKPACEDLAGDVWRYLPQKTQRRGREAMPGLVDVVKARVARRLEAAKDDQVRPLGATPFLWDPRVQRAYTPDELYRRFIEARTGYLASPGALATLGEKHLQDCRDTCITRLYAAGVSIARMWTWTGHSQKGIEDILRDHYISLLAEGQKEMAAQLQAWAAKEQLRLSVS